MTLITYKLYLIKIRCHPVALIPAKNPLESVRKYVERTGFASDHRYLCCGLMTNTVAVNHTIISGYGGRLIIKADAETIGDNYLLKISSQQVTSCDGVIARININDINNGLFIRPAVEEVRKCVGFSREPIYKLRKFCI